MHVERTELPRRIVSALKQLHANNRTAKSRLNHYGFEVSDVSDGGGTFSVTMTLRAGEEYCCFEPGCHFRLGNGSLWHEFRELLAEQGVVHPPNMTIRNLHFVVDDGAIWRLEGKTHRSPKQAFDLGPIREGT
jgi:hypothetical protein